MISIDRIECSIVELPLVKPLIVSFGAVTHANDILVKIYDKSGVCGIGEASMITMPVYKPEYLGSVWATLKDIVSPLLVGKTFQTPAEAERSLDFIRGNYFSKAAVSLALHDLYARLRQESVVKTIGGVRDKLTISSTVSLYADPRKSLDEATKFYESGIRWIKLKVCPGKDIGHIRILQENLPDAKIMIDANASYAYNADTVSLFKQIDDMGLFCIEQPLRWNDLVFHAKLQAQMKTDIALDESLDDEYGARQALEIGACRAGNIKLSRVGGFGECVRIEQFFKSRNLPVWIGGMMETPVGFHANLVASTLEGCSLPIDYMDASHLVEGFHDLFDSSLYTIKGDEVLIDTSFPGFGLTLDEGMMKKYTKETFVCQKL